MKKQTSTPYIINSISEQHRLLGLPKPQHPLVSVYKFEDIKYSDELFSKNYIELLLRCGIHLTNSIIKFNIFGCYILVK